MFKSLTGTLPIVLLFVALEAFIYLYHHTAFVLLLPLATIAVVSVIYFANNPVGHDRKFRIRTYLNWLPLGLTYASLYMGRYNLTVGKTSFGEHLMSKEDFGTIFGVGAVVYGLSFLVNGPLTERLGGKAAILVGAMGAAVANIALGVISYKALEHSASIPLFWPFLFLYAINMYFQSFGAVSIVKVNAAWFHIRERGVFGGIFGTLISLGIFLAFDLNGILLDITKKTDGSARTWVVFLVPAAILLLWVVIDLFLVADTPGKAGYQDFNTGDAGSGETSDDEPLSVLDLYKRLLTHPVILTMVAIEFCSGVLRNGIMHWGKIYSKEVGIYHTDFFFSNWGLILMVAGISGGFVAGLVSDKLFQSRRGPSAFFLYAGMFVGFLVMSFAVPFGWNGLLGFLAFFISMCVIGVHGMLSGTASMDFGGKKAAATTAGIIDGFVYLGTGFQSIALGYITERSWVGWPLFLLPFTLIGLYFTRRIWNAFPDAKKGGAHG